MEIMSLDEALAYLVVREIDKMNALEIEISKLGKMCNVPECGADRDNHRYPFCMECMGNTLRRYVWCAKLTSQYKYTPEVELVHRFIDMIQQNWKEMVKEEQEYLDEHGYKPENYP